MMINLERHQISSCLSHVPYHSPFPLFKVAAINKIMSSAKRVKIDPKNLMRIVFGVAFAVIIALVLWTVVDKSCATKRLDLVNEGEQAVILSYSCESESDGWKTAALAWEFFLLLCASVLAFQTRKVEQREYLPIDACIFPLLLCRPSCHHLLSGFHAEQ